MRVSHEGFQATELTPAPGATTVRPARTARRAATARADASDGAEPRRVGIVFVHGIGDQKPAETFLAWSKPLVRMLEAWRTEQGYTSDPVVRSQFAFDNGALPFLELDIPAHNGRPAARWVVTEALWAEAIRGPGLDEAASYLRDRLRTVVSGIRAGQRPRDANWDRRTARAGEAASAATGWKAARLAELDRRRWSWIGVVDWLQRSVLTQLLLVVPIVVVGYVLLLLWVPLRRIPIGPLRDFVDARLVDSFLTDWFGDLPVLLDDPVQAANVRARTVDAVRALRGQECDAIVLVAHSGGAIVSFETLLDPAYLDDPQRAITVDKLVTHGQGLNLGWRLEHAYRSPLESGNRLAGNLGKLRPDLRWVDIWSTFDPAPSGPLLPPDRVDLDVLDPGLPARAARESGDGLLGVESRPVANLMSIRNDHGSYWDNDEGFLVALVRHLDDPRGSGAASRFYPDPDLRTVRIERRRQRVAVLGAWRWIVALAAGLVVIGGGVVAGAPRVASNSLALIWERVPGGELVAGPLAAAWGSIGALLSFAGRDDLAERVLPWGPVLMGAFVLTLVVYVFGLIGGFAWSRWDVRERTQARLEQLPRTERRFALAAGIALVAALVGMVATALAAGDPQDAWARTLAGIVVAALALLGGWASSRIGNRVDLVPGSA